MWRGRQLCLKLEQANAKPTHCTALAALRNFGWFLMMLSFGHPRLRCWWKWGSRQMSKIGSPRLDLGLDAQDLGLDAHLPVELGLVYFPAAHLPGHGCSRPSPCGSYEGLLCTQRRPQRSLGWLGSGDCHCLSVRHAPTFWLLCFKTYSSPSPRRKFLRDAY